MGICESANGGKPITNDIIQKKPPEIDPNEQTFDYKNVQDQSGVRPSIFSKSENMENINSLIQSNAKPELAKYDRSVYASGKSDGVFNRTSLLSSGVSEQEIIIKGEINPIAENKEEDFANSSFKKLVQNKGGRIIENGESNVTESRKESTFDLGKENLSEIHSTVSIPMPIMENNGITPNNNINNIGNMNDIKGGIISGKYDKNGILIPNNSNIIINGRIDKKNDKNKNLFEKNNYLRQKIIINNNNILKDSNKINISLHESCPRIDSFLNVPKNDQPPPNYDELSDSTLRNSNIFEN